MAEIGDDRTRFATAGSLKAYAEAPRQLGRRPPRCRAARSHSSSNPPIPRAPGSSTEETTGPRRVFRPNSPHL
ncbi:hypothetical protein [Streptomyces sp. 900105245]